MSCCLSLTGSRARSTSCLCLARSQKVDLTKLSILRLAEQYLDYIEAARYAPA